MEWPISDTKLKIPIAVPVHGPQDRNDVRRRILPPAGRVTTTGRSPVVVPTESVSRIRPRVLSSVRVT